MTPATTITTRNDNTYSLKLNLLAVGIVIASLLSVASPASAQDIWASGAMKGQQAKVGLISWVQVIGVCSIIVCGMIWIFTGRANWRWLAGAGGGLFIAGLADPIVSFFVT